MAIASIFQWRPRDGKLAEFMGNVAQAKKIHERLGGKVRIWQSAIGGQPMTVGYVVEHDSWTAFGEFSSKIESDTEWQEFFQKALSEASADLLQNSVVVEIQGL